MVEVSLVQEVKNGVFEKNDRILGNRRFAYLQARLPPRIEAVTILGGSLACR